MLYLYLDVYCSEYTCYLFHKLGGGFVSAGRISKEETAKMQKKISNLPFRGTEEQALELQKIIDANKHDTSRLMGVMQQAQDIYGYLPFEVQKMIADGMGVPLEKVYGVATFYAQFVLEPQGEHVIGVCLGTACYVKGSQAVLDRLAEELKVPVGKTTADGKFTLNATRCLGACGLAPVMMIGDEVYGRLTPDEIPGILAKY